MISYNEGNLASNYPAARALSLDMSATWSSLLRPFLANISSPRVLDLGCGTGRFSTLIAREANVAVIGVDPSIAMLQEAQTIAKTGNISYMVAQGERLPFAGSCCDLVWLSQVVHHLRDRRACAAELYRVLRPQGVVLIRGTFGDRLDGFPTLFRFFPSSRELTARFPTIREVLDAFEREGFFLQSSQRVQQKTCESLVEFASRTKLRADSTLVQVPDSEFEACQKALEEVALQEEMPSPVIETLEFLSLRRA